MKANGFGRSTVGHWIKVPTRTSAHDTFNSFHQLQYHMNTTPFEVLSDSSIHNLNKLILPNGETIFSSFRSIESISSYFSNIVLRSDHPTNLAQTSLSNLNNITSSTNSFTSKLSNDSNNYINEFVFDQISLDSNPQSPQNIEQPSESTSRQHQSPWNTAPANMSSITRFIDHWLEQVDFDIIHPDRARTICKQAGALLFITTKEWLKISHIYLPDLKETLQEFYD